MSAGEKTEFPDQLRPSVNGGEKVTRGKRGRPRQSVAPSSEIDVTDKVEPRNAAETKVAVGVSRDRALRRLLAGLRSLDAGDFSARLDPSGDALVSELAEMFNNVATRQGRLSEELNRIALSVGREGKMRDRATIGPAGGSWAGSVDALNSLITDLVQPTSEVARVIKAVAEGDLSQKVELEIEGKTVQGEFFRIGSTVNRMVDQLNAFASEVTRVAREVGTEGRDRKSTRLNSSHRH